MNYKDDKYFFSFNLLGEWKLLPIPFPKTLVLGDSFFQIYVQAPIDGFIEASDRVRQFWFPECSIIPNVKLGGENNTIMLIHRLENSGVISTIKDDIHYYITYNDPESFSKEKGNYSGGLSALFNLPILSQ